MTGWIIFRYFDYSSHKMCNIALSIYSAYLEGSLGKDEKRRVEKNIRAAKTNKESHEKDEAR